MGLGRKKGPGGGGGVGAVLTVTAPAGVTVSVSKDGKTKTKTANSEGLAVFTGLETGTWTLTITDGSQTSTKTVSVTADYSTVIAFFSATINITYPSGSTCTCSDGSTTFTAPDTSGTWACVVPNAGTWTVSCTDGTESKSETVTITADGQSFAVELAYWNGELYKAGNEYEAITGGWQTRGWPWDSGCESIAPKVTKNSDSMSISLPDGDYAGGILEIKKDFNLSDCKTITVNISNFSLSDKDSEAATRSGFVVISRSASYPTSPVAKISLASMKNGDNVLDVSKVNNAYDIGFCMHSSGNATASFKINSVIAK